MWSVFVSSQFTLLHSRNVAIEYHLGSAPVSLLSNEFIREGIGCRNSSLLKSKHSVRPCDRAHFRHEFAPCLILFERAAFVFRPFFFFFLNQSGIDHKSARGWYVPFTRKAGAEGVKRFSLQGFKYVHLGDCELCRGAWRGCNTGNMGT